ncbi:MAG TPA: SMC-Scp complex subunit ScpB [Mycobacteriales bacterium]|jgi:segregation and condensation protein B|nr:SMC-Scp complex subunit ScpB [Mycobacteriales bacterium]
MSELRAALEAILMVVEEPVDVGLLAQVLECPREEVDATLHALAAEYDDAGRGFQLRAIAGGWRFYTRPELAPYVERFVRDGQPAKLSQAALETLAVVAYRQPTTRSRIAAVRGVNVDAVIRTLLTRGLIAETGIERETGAILYGTTEHFLERLGLASTEELPPLAEYLPDHTALDDDASVG